MYPSGRWEPLWALGRPAATPMPMPGRATRELRWFAGGFGLPFAAMILFDLTSRESPLSVSDRLLSLEDTCAYGTCLTIPLLAYAVVRTLAAVRK